MAQAGSTLRADILVAREIAPGVRLHLLRTDRFTTTLCRVVLHRDLGGEATATALLASVLQSATARHTTRQALAHRLADLYGASLGLSVEKLGDRQLLTGALEWPTAHVPRASRLLGDGLGLLREVFSEPKRASGRGRGGQAPFDPDIVRTEQVNHVRLLRALGDDKVRYAARRCLAASFAGEPFGLDVLGREEDVAAATPEALAVLHRRLLATAPVDVYLVGNVGLRPAVAAVRRHLLWPGRGARLRRPPRLGVPRGARARPRRLVEAQPVEQGRLVMAFRAPLGPRSAMVPAAQTLAGVLGGGAYARLFKVVRETHGLCYDVSAGWLRTKGLLLVQSGIDSGDERRARRLILRLFREVASGRLEEKALRGFREAVASRFAAMQDDRGAALAWYQECTALGLDPSPARALDALRSVAPSRVRRVGSRLGLDTSFFLTADGRGPRRPR